MVKCVSTAVIIVARARTIPVHVQYIKLHVRACRVGPVPMCEVILRGVSRGTRCHSHGTLVEYSLIQRTRGGEGPVDLISCDVGNSGRDRKLRVGK